MVAINAFPTDTKAELDLVERKCRELGVNVALSEVWAKGGEGGIALANEVVRLCEEDNSGFSFSYELDGSIEDKLNQIVQKVYGGKCAVLTANAKKQAAQLEAMGYGNCPICVAKTQYSLTDNPSKLGAPTDFEVTVRNLKISAGAGFIVALTGEIMTMPVCPNVLQLRRSMWMKTAKSPVCSNLPIDISSRIIIHRDPRCPGVFCIFPGKQGQEGGKRNEPKNADENSDCMSSDSYCCFCEGSAFPLLRSVIRCFLSVPPSGRTDFVCRDPLYPGGYSGNPDRQPGSRKFLRPRRSSLLPLAHFLWPRQLFSIFSFISAWLILPV